jgi:hypothetical protein
MLHSLRAVATLSVRLRTPGLYIINLIIYLLITMYSDKYNQYLDKDIPTRKIVSPHEEKQIINRGRRFLKGPIPFPFLLKASKLPGKTLHVFIVIWFLHGVTKNKIFNLKNSLLREFGVQRHAGYRALIELEKAGLISVVRCQGRNPQITINCDI